jgi:hypothetical protein
VVIVAGLSAVMVVGMGAHPAAFIAVRIFAHTNERT